MPPIKKDEASAAPATPVKDALDTTGGPQFAIDQMADVLERAVIAARGRTDDLSIRWGSERVADENTADGDDIVWVTRFWVHRHSTGDQHGLTVDEAKAALDAMGA